VAELYLDTLQRAVQELNSVVAALRVAGVRERVRLKPPHASLEGDDVYIVDEVIRSTAAVATKASNLTALESFHERPEIRGREPMNAFRIDDGAIVEDLEDHSELGSIVRPAYRHACDQWVGGRHCRADSGSRGDPRLGIVGAG
jgi:hypothetical protein